MINFNLDKVFYSRSTTICLSFFCVLSVIYGFWFLRFGFDINDEAYQTMNAIDPIINPQAVLSSYISNLWGNIFGFSFYAMRVQTFCLNVLSIGFTTCFLFYKTKKQNLSLLLFGVLVCVSLCIPNKSRLIGWDCYAIFFTTLSLISMVKIWDESSVKRLLFLGLLSGCAILSRFPDLVIIPVAIFSILISSIKKKGSALIVYLSSVFLSIVLLLSLIYHGEIFQWISDMKSSFVSGHDAGKLIRNYLHTGKFELIDVILLIFLLALNNRFAKTQRDSWLFDVFTLVLFILIMFYKLDKVYYPVNRLLTSGILLMLSLYVFNAKGASSVKYFLRSLVIVGCCMVPMAGSDCGTTKFMNLSVIPIVLVLFQQPHVGQDSKSEQNIVSIFWMILVSGTIIMPFYTARHTTFDGGWDNAGFAVNHVYLKNNTTTQERAAEINEMIEDGLTILPEDYLVIGHNNRRFFSEYLWGHRNELWPHSWSDKILEDEEKIDLLLDKINRGEIHDIVFVKYGANDFVDFEHNPMRSAIEFTGNYVITDYEWFVLCEDQRIR